MNPKRAFIFVPPVTNTVSGWPKEAWSWFLGELATACNGLRPSAVLRSGYAAAGLLQALSEHAQWSTFSYTRGGVFGPLQEALAYGSCESEGCVLIRPECVFSPSKSIPMLVDFHIARRAMYSYYSNVPDGVSPLVINRELVDFCANVEDLSGEWDVALNLRHLLLKAAQMMSPSGETRIATLDAVAAHNLSPYRIPLSIDLGNSADLERLSELTRGFTLSRGGDAGLMYDWKQRLQAEEDEAVEVSHPRLRCVTDRKRPRVLFCSSMSGFSGGAESLCRLVECLPRTRVDCIGLLGAEGHFADELRRSGASVRVARRDFMPSSLASIRTVSDLLDDVDPDIVHINEYSGLMLPLLARVRDLRVIFHARTCNFPPEVIDCLRLSHHIIAVSRFVAEHIRAAGVRSTDLSVIYDGVDSTFRKPASSTERREAKRRHGIPEDRVTILLVARFDKLKRHDLLLNALSRLLPEHALHVLLVGESFSPSDISWEASIDRLIVERGLQQFVTKKMFTRDLRDIQMAADIGVLCSDQEGLGTSILEAMAMGIPVVVSDRGGLQELVSMGESSGSVVQSGNVNELADAISPLAGSEQLRFIYGRNGREKSLALFDASICAHQVMSLYEALLGSVGTPNNMDIELGSERRLAHVICDGQDG